jgi:hypothetical protein
MAASVAVEREQVYALELLLLLLLRMLWGWLDCGAGCRNDATIDKH